MVIAHNPPGLFPPYRCYSHAVEVRAGARTLYISGLNGFSADMDYSNLVSLRTYLADPAFDEANVGLRVKYLGTHRPALTVICCQLLDPRWKLAVEAVAACNGSPGVAAHSSR